MKAYCAILAGGVGTRMGAGTPKQFLMLRDAPIIIHTLKRVVGFDLFDRVVVAVHPQWRDHFMLLLSKHGIEQDKLIVVDGGVERIDSIRNSLFAVRSTGESCDTDVVVVHDAVRPFVSKAIMEDSIISARKHGACVAVVPATDTILDVEEGVVASVPPRSRLFHGQAPDSAQILLLEKSIAAITASERKYITGTAQILLANGVQVWTIPGDVCNMKITTASDLTLAERLIA